MKQHLSRRDFLKLTGTASAALPALRYLPRRQANGNLPNILILVYDAWSAHNISLYGYERDTTPNLRRLAERATVFHKHYSAGNFTFPGTSSLVTGTYPWTHRGFSPGMGIDPQFETRNMFQLFDQYFRISYTHNAVAHVLLRQIQESMDRLKPRQDLYLDRDPASGLFFVNDEDIANIGWWQSIVKKGRKGTYSLFFSHFYRDYKDRILARYADVYPRGLPNIRDDNFFLPEDATDWVMEEVSQMHGQETPFLGYFHYLPPHDPYHTRAEFVDAFRDDAYQPVEKPQHIFSRGRTYAETTHSRRMYDEFCLLADQEIGRTFDHLEQTGILDDTIVIVTSDHGEMFERGLEKHYFESLHQPVVHVPLLIFTPGTQTRQDVTSVTSSTDLLPTLLHLAGQPIPDWIEGEVLPPFAGSQPDPDRSVYAVEAKGSEQYGEIHPVSLMIVRDGYKLTYYDGWLRQEGKGPLVELYEIEDDPEEMFDLSEQLPEVRNALLSEVLKKAGLA
jgi:arylsulfatase A-like enzyme